MYESYHLTAQAEAMALVALVVMGGACRTGDTLEPRDQPSRPISLAVARPGCVSPPSGMVSTRGVEGSPDPAHLLTPHQSRYYHDVPSASIAFPKTADALAGPQGMASSKAFWPISGGLRLQSNPILASGTKCRWYFNEYFSAWIPLMIQVQSRSTGSTIVHGPGSIDVGHISND